MLKRKPVLKSEVQQRQITPVEFAAIPACAPELPAEIRCVLTPQAYVRI